MLRRATNNPQDISDIIILYIRLGDNCISYIFGIIHNLSPGVLVSKAFIDEQIKRIIPNHRLIKPCVILSVLIIAQGSEQVNEFHNSEPLPTIETSKTSHQITLTSPVIIL